MNLSPRRLLDAIVVLPVAWFAANELASKRSVHESLRRLERWAADNRRSAWAPVRVTRAARDALWLLGRRQRACLPRSFTVFALLSAMGERPVIVTGVVRSGGELTGHAWVELGGQPIPGSGDEDSPGQFRESLRYPA